MKYLKYIFSVVCFASVAQAQVTSEQLNIDGSASGVASFETRTGAVVSANGDYTGAEVTNTPAGDIAAITVQAAVDELDSEKESSITAGLTTEYFRGDKSFQTLNGAAVVNTPAGDIAATEVQSAINELDGEKAKDVITTRGDIVTGNSSGEPSRIALGTTGQVVKSDGTDSVYDDLAGSEVTNTPAGDIAATDAQAAIDELDSEKTAKATLTAKGSIYGASAASIPAELAVGTDGQVIVADSGETSGLNYADDDHLGDVDQTLSGNRTITMGSNTLATSGGNVGISESTPTSDLHLGGSLAYKEETISGLTNPIGATNRVMLADSSSNNVTLNLPTAASSEGRVYTVKAIDLTNVITIDPDAAETIDGAATFVFGTVDDSITFISDGSNWVIISASLAAGGVDTTIYSTNGTLSGNRTATMAGNTLTWQSTGEPEFIIRDSDAATGSDMRQRYRFQRSDGTTEVEWGVTEADTLVFTNNLGTTTFRQSDVRIESNSNGGRLELREDTSNGTEGFELRAADSMVTSVSLTLPNGIPNPNEVFSVNSTGTTLAYIGGGLEPRVITTSGGTLVGNTSNQIDTGTIPIAQTLPANPRNSTEVLIFDRDANASTNNITIAAGAGDTIDGAASKIISDDRGAFGIRYDVTNLDWVVIHDTSAGGGDDNLFSANDTMTASRAHDGASFDFDITDLRDFEFSTDITGATTGPSVDTSNLAGDKSLFLRASGTGGSILVSSDDTVAGTSINLGASQIKLRNSASATAPELKFFDDSTLNFTGFKSSAVRTGDLIYELPTTDPTAAQVLSSAVPSSELSVLSWVDNPGLLKKGTVTSDAEDGQGIYNFDASGGAFDWTLPAATGSQDRRLFIGEDVETNNTTVKVQIGEDLNDVTNGSFVSSTDGQVLLATDRATGKWDITTLSAGAATELDWIMIEDTSGGTASVSENGGNRVNLNTVFNSKSGTSFVLSVDKVTLAAGRLYEISFDGRFTSGETVVVYDFTNGVVLTPPSNASATDFRSGATALVEPSASIEIGMSTVSVHTTADSASGTSWMTVKVLPNTTIVDPATVVVNDQTGSKFLDIGDMRIQWGSDTGGDDVVITLPAAFEDTSYSVTGTINTGENFPVMVTVSKTTTTFTVDTSNNARTSTSAKAFDWMAVGPKP